MEFGNQQFLNKKDIFSSIQGTICSILGTISYSRQCSGLFNASQQITFPEMLPKISD